MILKIYIYIYILKHVIRLLSKTINNDTKSDIKKKALNISPHKEITITYCKFNAPFNKPLNNFTYKLKIIAKLMHHLIYNFNFHLMYDIFFWGKIPWHPLNFRVFLFGGEVQREGYFWKFIL